jgi:outer membrane protein assembly factor BamB
MTKLIISVSLLVFIPFHFANAQHIITALGGQAHTGVYDTKPIRKFNKVIWKYQLEGNGSECCIIDNNTIYVSSTQKGTDNKYFGNIYALSLDGGLIWKNKINKRISHPNLKDTILYYGSDEIEGKQYAVSSRSGKVLWEFSTASASCFPPAIVGNWNFFGSHGNKFYVLNNKTGALVKEETVGGGVCCSPSVFDSIVYFVDRTGILHAYNSNTLSDMWIFESGAASLNAPAIVDGVAYLVNEKGGIFAINTKTGKLIWSFKTDDSMYRSPAVNNGVATVITSNGHLYAFDAAKGNVIWDLRKPGLDYTNTAIVQDIVYVGCGDNYLYALDLKTGEEIWNFKAENPVNTPTVQNGIVYFTSGNYQYAIK